MKGIGLNMESLFHEKLLLYRDLLDVLEQERKNIIDIDVESLWKVSERKNKIVRKIEAARRQILELLDDASISHGMSPASFDASKLIHLMPDAVRENLGKVQVALVTLKNDVNVRLEENRRYVGEYLTVLDELIGVITQAGRPKPVYDRSRYPAKASANLFLHREV